MIRKSCCILSHTNVGVLTYCKIQVRTTKRLFSSQPSIEQFLIKGECL